MFRARMPVVAAVLVLATAGCTATTADRPASSTAPSSTSVADRVAASTALLEATMAADEPGCSAAAGVDGEVAWTGTRGLADVEAGTALTTDTRFHIASVGKQFTATAILLLEQEGKLALTDPLSRHVPNLPPCAERLTVQDLMHHTSGLPEVYGLLQGAGFTKDDAVTQQDALGEIAEIEELNFTPGSVFEYANTNYVLLAEVVHSASGRDLPAYLQERVFGPLGLTMSFGYDGGEPTTGYTTTLGRLVPAGSAWLLYGPGFIVTTPGELVRWADNYRTGAVGSPALLDQVTRDAYPMTSAPDTDRYGAGVVLTADGTLGHTGGSVGTASWFVVSPDRHSAIAIGCNRNDNEQAGTDLGDGLATIWFDRS